MPPQPKPKRVDRPGLARALTPARADERRLLESGLALHARLHALVDELDVRLGPSAPGELNCALAISPQADAKLYQVRRLCDVLDIEIAQVEPVTTCDVLHQHLKRHARRLRTILDGAAA